MDALHLSTVQWEQVDAFICFYRSEDFEVVKEHIWIHLKCGNRIVRSRCVQCRDGRVQICDLCVQSVHHSFDAIALRR